MDDQRNGTASGGEGTKAAKKQIVLVLQGGGALGAYQAGVYEGLHEANIEPDWIVGISIGAINAALIAGNPRERRVEALKAFWSRVAHDEIAPGWFNLPWLSPSLEYWRTVSSGIPAFFTPNTAAFLGAHNRLGADEAGYYSTAPLGKTLDELVDFNLIGAGKPRLTVGAAHVATGRMCYFDSTKSKIDARHIMASGALPPAFPAVRIDGELYWDGGILSNTPTETVFDANPRRNSLIFAVHLWNPIGTEPRTMWEVLHRQKDIQYSSRVTSHIAVQQKMHRLRHIISALKERLPASERNRPEIAEMTAYGCLTQMHVVRLLSPSLADEDQTKDVDFSQRGIKARWQAGLAAARKAIAAAPWNAVCDPLDGVILHEPDADGSYRTSHQEATNEGVPLSS